MLFPSLFVALIVAGCLWAAAACCGFALLPRLGAVDHGFEALVRSATLGWGVLGALWFLVAWAGWLRLPLVLVVLGVCTVVGWRRTMRSVSHAVRGLRAVDALWLLPAVPSGVLALLPPHGFDALNYHLPFARAFASSGGLPVQPNLRFEVFPALGELWQAVALQLGDALAFWQAAGPSSCGAQAAKALALGAAFCTAGWVAHWARGLNGDSSWSGRLAAAIWLGHPLVVWLSGQAYVELHLALFVVAGFALVSERKASRPLWLAFAAGGAFGVAAAIKYLGLAAAVLGGVVLLARSWRRQRGRSDGQQRPGSRFAGGAVVCFALSFAAVAGPTYLRLWQQTGNPVHPYFASEASTVEVTDRDGAEDRIAVVIVRFRWWVSLPWTVVFDRDEFHRAAIPNPWTPLLFVLVLAVLMMRSACSAPDRRAAAVPLVCSALYAASLVVHDEPRLHHLLPAAALLSVPMAWALWRITCRCSEALRARMSTVIVAALLVPSFGYGAYKLVDIGGVPISEPERQRWLAARLPGYTPLRELAESCPSSEDTGGGSSCRLYLLGRERLRWYAPPGVTVLGDVSGRYPHRQVTELWNRPRRLRRLLKQEWSVDYLLVSRQRGRGLLRRTGGRWFDLVAEDPQTLLLSVR